MADRETGLAKKMALREAGDSQKHTSFPESQGWLSINDLSELRKLDMETKRPSPDMIAVNALTSGTRIGGEPMWPEYRWWVFWNRLQSG